MCGRCLGFSHHPNRHLFIQLCNHILVMGLTFLPASFEKVFHAEGAGGGDK